jgi:hypothetical protein
VEVLLLSGRIGPLLAIKPGIDQNCFFTARRIAGDRTTQDANQNQ